MAVHGIKPKEGNSTRCESTAWRLWFGAIGVQAVMGSCMARKYWVPSGQSARQCRHQHDEKVFRIQNALNHAAVGAVLVAFLAVGFVGRRESEVAAESP